MAQEFMGITFNIWKETIYQMPIFEDGYAEHRACPHNDSGLYLIGTTTFNPYTDEKYYWIKVGVSTNLKNRIRQYKPRNPAVFVIDTELMDRSEIYGAEKYCQCWLMENAIAKAKESEEWFLVNRKTYLEINEKGFKFFF
jgi:hypothetical protein